MPVLLSFLAEQRHSDSYRFIIFRKCTSRRFSREREEQQSLLDVSRHLFSSNIGKFTLYVTLINLTVNIAGPFFSVYMLRDLGFSYTAYVINASAFTVAFVVFQAYWGRRADRAGNVRIIQVTSFLLPLVPIFWIFSSNVYFLLFARLQRFCLGGIYPDKRKFCL